MKKIFIFLCLVILFPSMMLAESIGPTQLCQTLWSVALRNRPNKSITMSQAMWAILKKNPQAFYGGNINGLKPNMFLVIPSATEMSAIPSKLAKQRVAAQMRQWSMQKQRLIAENRMPDLNCIVPTKTVRTFKSIEDAGQAFTTQLNKQVADLKGQVSRLHSKVSELTTKLQQQLTENQILIDQQNKIATASQNAVAIAQKNTAQLQDVFASKLAEAKEQLHRIKVGHLSELLKASSSNNFKADASQPMPTETTMPSATAMAPLTDAKPIISPMNVFNQIRQTVIAQPLLFVALPILVLFLLILFFMARHASRRRHLDELKEDVVEETPPTEEEQTVAPTEEAPAPTRMVLEPEKRGFTQENTPPQQESYNYLAGEDVVASKLDLSKALIEMGNTAHARQVLESVIEEGDEAQRAEAEKLLRNLS